MGQRVEVFDGTGANRIGLGTYSEDVEVYAILMPDGSLRSLRNAEQKPEPEQIPAGGRLFTFPKNPKIVMDDGTVRYGCQTWWKPVKA